MFAQKLKNQIYGTESNLSTEIINFVLDKEFTSKLCFNETLAIVNQKEEELGEFTGKIRKCNSYPDTGSTTIIIKLYSTSISKCDEEIGMSLITKTTTTFNAYDEKWSQWLVSL